MTKYSLHAQRFIRPMPMHVNIQEARSYLKIFARHFIDQNGSATLASCHKVEKLYQAKEACSSKILWWAVFCRTVDQQERGLQCELVYTACFHSRVHVKQKWEQHRLHMGLAQLIWLFHFERRQDGDFPGWSALEIWSSVQSNLSLRPPDKSDHLKTADTQFQSLQFADSNVRTAFLKMRPPEKCELRTPKVGPKRRFNLRKATTYIKLSEKHLLVCLIFPGPS